MNVDYKIIYSERKRINITVERDRSVTVRAPQNTDINLIQKAVESKKLWLFEKLKHKQKYPPRKITKEFVSGESIMYLGRNYKLIIVPYRMEGIEYDQKFVISKYSQDIASQLFYDWYLERAKEKIPPKVKYYANNIGVSYKDIMISDLRYRWGSCTSKKNLNFNWRLIKAPIYVIEYVIVHELAHLLEANHTPDFWNIVSIQAPRYKQAKKWLLENGKLLEEDL